MLGSCESSQLTLYAFQGFFPPSVPKFSLERFIAYLMQSDHFYLTYFLILQIWQLSNDYSQFLIPTITF